MNNKTSTDEEKKHLKTRVTWEASPEYKTKDWRVKKLRVAYYIRVSTDSDDQLNSFDNKRNILIFGR
jgi:hypothetical protein